MKKKIINESNIPILIAKAVRRERIIAGFTRTKLAIKSRLSKASIMQIENGESNPPIYTVYKIAEAMGIDTCRLLGNI